MRPPLRSHRLPGPETVTHTLRVPTPSARTLHGPPRAWPALPASLPRLLRSRYLPRPASTVPASGDWGIWSHKVALECPGTSMLPPPHRLACSGLARNSHPFGTYYPRLPPPLRKHSPRDPHTQHKAKNSGQIKNNNKEPGQHLEAGNRTFAWEGCLRVTYVRRHMIVDPYSPVPSLLRSIRSTHPLANRAAYAEVPSLVVS